MKLIITFSRVSKPYVSDKRYCCILDALWEIWLKGDVLPEAPTVFEKFRRNGKNASGCSQKSKKRARGKRFSNSKGRPTAQPTDSVVLCDLRVFWQSPR